MPWHPEAYARQVKTDIQIEKDEFGFLWQYKPDTGHYIKADTDAAVRRQVSLLVADNHNNGLPKPGKDNIYRQTHGEEVVRMLKDLKPNIWLNPPPPIITTLNKTLKFQTDGSVISEPHSPDNYTIISLHLPYDHQATAKPTTWKRFLDDILPDPGDQLLLQQWAGATLNPGRQNPKGALFIYGPADAGKSVLSDTLTHLYGPRNVAGVTPHDLARDPFRAFNLVGALANIVPDLPTIQMGDPSLFKMMTGGFDRLSLRIMYKQETYGFYPTCGNLFTGNALPDSWADDSDGFFARRLALKAHAIPEADRNPRLRAELQNELPGILNWAIVGHKKLHDNGWRWAISHNTAARMRQAYEEANPHILWMEERTAQIPNAILPQKEAGDDYQEWLQERGDLGKDQQLSPKLRGTFYSKLRDEWSHLPTKKRAWIGVGLLTLYEMP